MIHMFVVIFFTCLGVYVYLILNENPHCVKDSDVTSIFPA